MSSVRSCVLISCFLFLVASFAKGSVTPWEGWEGDFWTDHAVVVAWIDKADRVQPGEEGRGSIDVAAKVRLVVATEIPVPTDLKFRYVAWPRPELANGPILEEPAVGKLYVLCLELSEHKWYLKMQYCAFFDSETMMQSLRDLEDRLLRRAEANVNWARAKYYATRFEAQSIRDAAKDAPLPAPRRGD